MEKQQEQKIENKKFDFINFLPVIVVIIIGILLLLLIRYTLTT